MKPALALVTICVLVGFVHAADDYPGDSGNAFVRTCSGLIKGDKDKSYLDVGKEMACLGYIDALKDGVTVEIVFARSEHKTVPEPYCIPDGVEMNQLIRVVLKYIEDHPESAHMRTPPLAVLAWRKAFPCR
jgi:hypothetical protein